MYDQSGNYIALAGVAVILLSKFGITTDAQTLVQIAASIMAFIGIIKQFRAHKNLAISAGAI